MKNNPCTQANRLVGVIENSEARKTREFFCSTKHPVLFEIAHLASFGESCASVAQPGRAADQALYAFVAESCKLQVEGSIPSGGFC